MIKSVHGKKMSNDIIGTDKATWSRINIKDNKDSFLRLIDAINKEKQEIDKCGGEIAIEKQHSKGKMTARERINYLLDENSFFNEIGKFAAYDMYTEYGKINSAGVIVGTGDVAGKKCMLIANDATVKAGAYFEVTLKKTLRAQQIAMENNLPIIYLVDSAGVFLPLQDQVFPDEGHFGKIFYNNARISARGITQIACVMGPCVAGGAYLPVMCDKYIIVKGGNMFLAGPALVKAAIGQNIDSETLGGAETHSAISGTADYNEENDIAGLDRIKTILKHINDNQKGCIQKTTSIDPKFDSNDMLSIFNPDSPSTYDMREVLARIIDNSEFVEYKKDYGKTILCGTAKIGGYNIGIIANQKINAKTKLNEIQMGGVIYSDSADKAARFVMNCNQDKIPLLFLHDVNGFMVGKDAEWGGIAKDGAKLVNVISNSTVPKISIILGGSYGAGNYAMSGRAYNPRFLYAWPSAKIAVMGGEQAAKTLSTIKLSKMNNVSDETKEKIFNEIKDRYSKQSNPRYAAARLWIDEIISPTDTRKIIIESLEVVKNEGEIKSASYGALQV
tara:strand:+ start:1554 stop:3233 length:1680 start_codon:yes stop_codon:yes gene_type:complete